MRTLLVATWLFSLVAHAEGVVMWQYADPTDVIQSAEPLANGNILITNTNAMYELVPAQGSGGTQINRLDDNWSGAHRLSNGNTLAAYTFPDQRVQEVTPAGVVAWEWGGGAPSCNDSTAANIVQLAALSNGDVLVSDDLEHRVMRITPAGTKAWQFGRPACDTETVPNGGLFKPNGVHEHPSNGNLLIAEQRMVFEITPVGASGGTLVRWFGNGVSIGADGGAVSGATDVAVLPNGHWVIVDSKNRRLIEVVPATPTSASSLLWQYGVTGVASVLPNHLHTATQLRLLPNGNFLVVDNGFPNVQEISRLYLDVASSPTLEVGQCSSALAVQVRDSASGARVAPFAVDVTLVANAPTLELFSDASCTTPLVSPVSFAAGVGSTSLYAKSTGAGNFVITASASGYVTEEQPISAAVTPSSPGAGPSGPGAAPPDDTQTGVNPWNLNVGCGCTGAPLASLSLWSLAGWAALARRRRRK